MNKRNLITLVIIFLGFNLYSQSKIDYFFEISPNYNYRSYKEIESNSDSTLFGNEDMIYKSFSSTYTSAEKPGYGFGFTAGIDYHLNSRLNLNIGLGYKKSVMKITEKYPIDPYPLDVTIDMSDDFSETFYHSFHYLVIPLELQYSPWIKGKFKFGFLLGSDVDLYLDKNYRNDKISSLEESKYEYASISKICFDIHGGFKLSYDISKSIRFYISPEFAKYVMPNLKYDIQIPSPLTDENLFSKINQYNYSAKINFGIAIM